MQFIGVHGRLGSGKDTVYERLAELHLDLSVKRLSFADKLKDSACALLGITREQMEEMKRTDATEIEVHTHHTGGMASVQSRMNMRTFLQRYGTESHRDIFGQNFWVDQALNPVHFGPHDHDHLEMFVFTDVRFENEAQAILNRGGMILRVIGDNEDTGDHASERPLPDRFITATIDNTIRDDGFAHLDNQLRELEFATA
jgi:hypothetical protein